MAISDVVSAAVRSDAVKLLKKASLDRQKVYEALKMLKEAFAPWYSLLATSRSVKPSKDANCSLHEGYLCTGAPRHIEFAPGRGCSYSTQGRLCW